MSGKEGYLTHKEGDVHACVLATTKACSWTFSIPLVTVMHVLFVHE